MKIIPFPHVETGYAEVSDGVFQRKHKFCRNLNHICKNFYGVLSENIISNCPYGFSVYKTIINGKTRIFTSLNIESKSDRKEVQRRQKDKEKRFQISFEEFKEYLSWFANTEANFIANKNLLRNIDSSTIKVEQKKEILDDTLHELRKLNNQLKKQAFILTKECEKGVPSYSAIDDKSKNILSTSQLISVRLNAYDFTLNPSLVESQNKISINIYKKFEKAKHCLEVLAKEKNINIIFIGSSHYMLECYEIFDILPFIIFENAIKYSPSNKDIKCVFITDNGNLKRIECSNYALVPSKDEIINLTDKGARGKSVSDKTDGTGKGLYLAKLICEFHEIKLSLKTDKVPSEIKTSEFDGLFQVNIEIAAPNKV
jgi:K+-sensing histidine kinase KdpD